MHRSEEICTLYGTNSHQSILLYNASSILQLTEKVFRILIEKEKLLHNSTSMSEGDYQARYVELELSYLLQFIKVCQRAALVLPRNLGHGIVKGFERQGLRNKYISWG